MIVGCDGDDDMIVGCDGDDDMIVFAVIKYEVSS